MKVNPIPTQGQPARKEVAPITMQTSKDTAARQKAMAAFMGKPIPSPAPGTDNNTQVANQNAISAEELSAIKPPVKEENEELTQTSDNTAESVEASTEEVTQAEASPEQVKPVEDPEVTKKFTELARQEKAYRAKQQALNEREQALKAREDALKSQAAPQQQTQPEPRKFTLEEIKANPLGILGDDLYNEFTQQMLQAPNKDPRVEAKMSQLESVIKNLEAKLEETDKSFKQQKTEAYNTAIHQIEMDAKRLVDSDPEFETIKAQGKHKVVKDLIVRTFEEDGVLMSTEEAAQLVENELLEELVGYTSKINKLKQRLSQSTDNSKPQQPKQQAAQTNQAQQQPQMKTLTNAAAATRKLSARERALLAFKGELK